MSTILAFLHRMFTRPNPRPVPTIEYLPESALPADPSELVRAGVIRPWRLEGATGEQWYTADVGAIAWWVENIGGDENE